jgi:hypothetical protein
MRKKDYLIKNAQAIDDAHRKIIKGLIKNADAAAVTNRKIIKEAHEQANQTHQILLQSELAYLILLYREEANPLYLWKAYSYARKNDLAIPTDVLKYFDEAAKAVLKIKSKRADRGVSQLKDALRLKDSDFSKYHNNEKRFNAYLLVQREIEKYGIPKIEAFANVAKKLGQKNNPDYDGVGTVRKMYYFVQKLMGTPLIVRKKRAKTV